MSTILLYKYFFHHVQTVKSARVESQNTNFLTIALVMEKIGKFSCTDKQILLAIKNLHVRLQLTFYGSKPN